MYTYIHGSGKMSLFSSSFVSFFITYGLYNTKITFSLLINPLLHGEEI